MALDKKAPYSQRYAALKLKEVVEKLPAVYDVEKVLSQIAKKMFSAECYNDDLDGVQVDNLLCFGDVAEIIYDGGVKEDE